jgi:hypothetical protein
LERKARFAAFYGLVAILQSKIAARPCSLPQMRQNSESEWNYKWVLEQAPIKTAFLVIFVLKSELRARPPSS